jgi:hypothetical protein
MRYDLIFNYSDGRVFRSSGCIVRYYDAETIVLLYSPRKECQEGAEDDEIVGGDGDVGMRKGEKRGEHMTYDI